MKGKYSIGYKDSYGDFTKVWQNGGTRKFLTIEEAKEYIEENKEIYKESNINKFKIMQGWKVIEEISI